MKTESHVEHDSFKTIPCTITTVVSQGITAGAALLSELKTCSKYYRIIMSVLERKMLTVNCWCILEW